MRRVPESSHDDTQRLKLLEIHERNVAVLQEQIARFGREYAPPHLLLRLEDELQAIERLSAEPGQPATPASPTVPAHTPGVAAPHQFDAFISHASADVLSVRRLARRLEAGGVSIWLDTNKIAPGQSITSAIEDGLAASRTVIVCLSESFLDSEWCRAEYRSVLHREITLRQITVIPVLVGDVETRRIPALLFDKRRLDARVDADVETLVRFLVNSSPPV